MTPFEIRLVLLLFLAVLIGLIVLWFFTRTDFVTPPRPPRSALSSAIFRL